MMVEVDILFPSLVALLVVLYFLYGVIYRLYLSPLSHFPGPKLAALTLWYELYYDLVRNGQYLFKIIDLHKKYGTIVRISPYELHVSDIAFHDELYASSASGKKRDKYGWWTKSFGLDLAMFATVDHDTHKMRRAALNPFFSTQSVRKLQPLIQERVDTLMERFREFGRDGEIMSASNAFAALTNDIVMQYSFACSEHRLEAPNFDPSFRRVSFFASTIGNIMKHAPWLNKFLQTLPHWFVERTHPQLASLVTLKRNIARQIEKVLTTPDAEKEHTRFPTIFHEILRSKQLPIQEQSVARLSDEALVLLFAGTLTTAWVLEISTFHLLRQPKALRRLKEELRSAISANHFCPSLSVLEHLPYLNAVMKEAFRLSYGVSGRLARISPDEPMFYNDGVRVWTVPAGTPVSMSAGQLHMDEKFFPCPRAFIPERWLDDNKLHTRLDKMLVNFSGGSRQCLGMALAHAELYLCMTALWSRYGSKEGVTAEGYPYDGVTMYGDIGVLELWETSLRDVEIEADSFLPIVQPNSQGVRIRVWG